MQFGFAAGLNRFVDGRFTAVPLRQNLPQYLITALQQDRAGRLWIGHYRGVGRLEDGKLVDLAQELQLENTPVFAIHEDRNGALWFGTRGGLYRYADGVVISALRRRSRNSTFRATVRYQRIWSPHT